jgi:hypothetical protein
VLTQSRSRAPGAQAGEGGMAGCRRARRRLHPAAALAPRCSAPPRSSKLTSVPVGTRPLLALPNAPEVLGGAAMTLWRFLW